MYSDNNLTNHLQTSNSISTKSKVIAEWNLNISENIQAIGNYKNRPTVSSGVISKSAPNTWVMEDMNTDKASRLWYGYTDYDTVIDGGYTDIFQTPVTFVEANLRQKALLSLEDCFTKFRPRSGINKLRMFANKKLLPVSGPDTIPTIFNRPRYYAAGVTDIFKYWSSYRISADEGQLGISDIESPYLIKDAAPFIMYKNKIPTNKIVMKIQTNVGTVDNGIYINPSSPTNADPYYIGSTSNYKSTPVSWSIEKYNDATNLWENIYTPTNASVDYWANNTVFSRVTAGKTYTASAYVQSETYSTKVHIRIDWYNSSGVLFSVSESDDFSVNSTSWTRAFVSAVAPVGAVNAIVTFRNFSYGTGSENMFWDNVYLKEANKNLISNSNFATTTSGWSAYTKDYATSIYRGTYDSIKRPFQPFSGTAYLVVKSATNATINSDFIATNTAFSSSVTAGQTYTLSASNRTYQNTTVKVAINWYGASGFISQSASTTVPSSNTSWKRITNTAVAPAGAIKAEAALFTVNYAGGSEESYWDNIILEQETNNNTNLISNYNFETDNLGWTAGSNATISRSTSRAYLDSASLTVTSTTDVFTNADGYFEISYGITNIPTKYKNNFQYIGELASASALPLIKDPKQTGQSYLIKSSNTDKGTYYVYNGSAYDTALSNYDTFVPSYGWYKSEESITNSQLFITELDKTEKNGMPIYMPAFKDGATTVYREFEYIKGLRVVVNSMANKETTFDLIELSPRICADLTNIVTSFSIKKFASDLGVSSLPVGQLLASTGSLSLFDYNQVFNLNNTNSILNISSTSPQITFINKNIQIKMYEIISQVAQGDSTYKDYYIPLKTMYADGFPQYDDANRNMTMNLRDLTFLLESKIAPEILLANVSLSYVVASLLDSIGFSNYKFLRKSGVPDTTIPYFMVPPNKTVMQVLQDLAIATQSAMFFDEANNFVVMSKEYLVPEKTTRDYDIMLYGSDTDNKKTNIINISSESNDIYNDGKIVHYNRYIKKQTNKVSVQKNLDKYQNLGYEKSVLWALDGFDEKTQSKNEENANQGGYPLSVAALEISLSDKVPQVVSGQIVNNIMFFGDSAYWLARYNGYFYSNGEIIKYNAIGYSMTGTSNGVWISSNQEFQKYYSMLPIGGKMYRNGKVRIYAEPYYNSDNTTLKDGPVAKHGRGQFGTTVTNHYAALDNTFYNLPVGSNSIPAQQSPWTTVPNALVTNYQYIFNRTEDRTDGNGLFVEGTTLKRNYKINDDTTQNINNNAKNISNKTMQTPTTTIGNFLTVPTITKDGTKVYSGQIQASALILTGPSFTDKDSNAASINYVKKDLSEYKTSYDTFGTRLRALGNSSDKIKDYQFPAGSYSVYDTQATTAKNEYEAIVDVKAKSLKSNSGGLAIKTNSYGEGYYFELAAIDYTNIKDLVTSNNYQVEDIFFYKMEIDKTTFTTLDLLTYLGGANLTIVDNKKVLESKTNAKLDLSSFNSVRYPAKGNIVQIRENSDNSNSSIVGVYVVDQVGSSTNPTSKWKLIEIVPTLKPTVLFSSFKNILMDDGVFASKVTGTLTKQDSVEDIGIRFSKSTTPSGDTYNFNLFLDGMRIGFVSDPNPITNGIGENVSLFVRGNSKFMFENVYAIDTTGADTTNTTSKDQQLFNIFDSSTSNIYYNKYSIGPLVRNGFLANISPSTVSTNKIFYEEFGAIMRECAYFNVKFDKSYPALRSIISPIPASLGGYFVTGYSSTPYRAEFLIFNTTDFSLDIGANKSYEDNLNISGITFTQESPREMTVDSYFNNRISAYTDINSNTNTFTKKFTDIKNNRLTYGSKAFTINSPYIQSEDAAINLMSWIIEKVSKPRKAVGVDVFGMPIIQLGDIVSFSYDTQKVLPNAVTGNNYVVYAIEHETRDNGPSTRLYLSEVV